MSPQPDNLTPGVTRHSQPASPAWLQLLPSAPVPHRPLHSLFTELPTARPPPALLVRRQRAPRGPGCPQPRGAETALPVPVGEAKAALYEAAASPRQPRHGAPGGTALPVLPAAPLSPSPQPAGLGRAGAAPVLSASPRGSHSQPIPHPHPPKPRGHHGDWRRPHTATAVTTGRALGTGHGSASVQSTAARYLHNHFLSLIHTAYLNVAFSMAGTPKITSPGEHL